MLSFKQFNESKMSELNASIKHHVDKHLEDYQSGKTGADQFGSRLEKAKSRVAKEHGLKSDTASKFVDDYVDERMKEHDLAKIGRAHV